MNICTSVSHSFANEPLLKTVLHFLHTPVSLPFISLLWVFKKVSNVAQGHTLKDPLVTPFILYAPHQQCIFACGNCHCYFILVPVSWLIFVHWVFNFIIRFQDCHHHALYPSTVPENIKDELDMVYHFTQEFKNRYGEAHMPAFRVKPLESILKNAKESPVREVSDAYVLGIL